MSVFLQPTATRAALDCAIQNYHRESTGLKKIPRALEAQGRFVIATVTGVVEMVSCLACAIFAKGIGALGFHSNLSASHYVSLTKAARIGMVMSFLAIITPSQAEKYYRHLEEEALLKMENIIQRALGDLQEIFSRLTKQSFENVDDNDICVNILTEKIDKHFSDYTQQVTSYRQRFIEADNKYATLITNENEIKTLLVSADQLEPMTVSSNEIGIAYAAKAQAIVDAFFVRLKNEIFSREAITERYGDDLDNDMLFVGIHEVIDSNKENFQKRIAEMIHIDGNDPKKTLRQLELDLEDIPSKIDDFAENTLSTVARTKILAEAAYKEINKTYEQLQNLLKQRVDFLNLTHRPDMDDLTKEAVALQRDIGYDLHKKLQDFVEKDCTTNNQLFFNNDIARYYNLIKTRIDTLGETSSQTKVTKSTFLNDKKNSQSCFERLISPLIGWWANHF